VPSPLKSFWPTYALNGGALEIREIESELETQRQLHDRSKIQDVRIVVRTRPTVLKPVVEIEAVVMVCSCVAGIGIRGKNLKTMRETFVGSQQQALVGCATFPFLDIDRSK
jgi:hypothetical protein